MSGERIEKQDNNSDVLLAAAKNKKNKKKQLFIAINVAMLLMTCGIYALFNQIKQFHEHSISSDHKTQNQIVIPNTSDINSLSREYKITLNPKLTEIANASASKENPSVFSIAAKEMVSWFDDQLTYSQKTGEPIESISFQKKILEAKQLINDFNVLLESHIKSLQKAFFEKNLQEFKRNFYSVENLLPNDGRLDQWRGELKIAEELFSHFDNLRVALAENDKTSELRLLKEIEALGHSSGNSDRRINELTQFFENKKYSQLIGQARKERNLGNLDKALRKIQQAKTLKDDSGTLDLFALEIRREKVEKRAEALKKKALESSEGDDWINALLYFKEARQLDATDNESKQGIILAERIIEKLNQLSSLKEMPTRLTDRDVENFAKKILKDSKLLANKSERLEKLREEVLALMNTILKPRTILINSDGTTRIEIKGVGFVEPTLERKIQLKPGLYTVHAACTGHKTNLIQLKVPIKGLIKPKRIVCGERI